MTTAGGWFDRNDAEQCCPSLLGPVSGAETLARLVHTTILEPKGVPFKRDDIFQKDDAFSNTCGDADGASLVRRDGLSDDELCERATELAEQKPGRIGRGALLGRASMLREIEHPDHPGERIIKVFDDPKATDQHHCVMRAAPLTRPRQKEIIEKIRRSFTQHVTPARTGAGQAD